MTDEPPQEESSDWVLAELSRTPDQLRALADELQAILEHPEAAGGPTLIRVLGRIARAGRNIERDARVSGLDLGDIQAGPLEG